MGFLNEPENIVKFSGKDSAAEALLSDKREKLIVSLNRRYKDVTRLERELKEERTKLEEIKAALSDIEAAMRALGYKVEA